MTKMKKKDTRQRDTSMKVDDGREQAQRDPSLAGSTVTLPGSLHDNPYEPRDAEANDPGPTPPMGLDWDRLGNILRYFPRFQAQRVDGSHAGRFFNEYISSTANTIWYCFLPQQPDQIWDCVGSWTPRDIHRHSVFHDVVIKRKHTDNFGAFCGQWFMNTDPALVYLRDD